MNRLAASGSSTLLIPAMGLLLTACGGGGGSDDPATTTPEACAAITLFDNFLKSVNSDEIQDLEVLFKYSKPN